jgi:hypothetical protein
VKPPFPFHPPLAAIYPVVALYAANLSLLPLAEVWTPALVLLGATCMVWLVSGLVLRSVARGALVSTMAQAVVFLNQSIESRIGIWGWAAIGLAAVVLAAWPWRWVATATRFLNVAGISLVALAIGSAAITAERIKQEAAKVASLAPVSSTRTEGRSPDVFYIILDGYGRSDQLKRVIGLDNSPFIKALVERGFVVANQSHSNYCQTEISLASSLNMEYVQSLVRPTGQPMADRSLLDRLIDRSSVSAEFGRRGYRYLAITTGFPALEFASADVVLPEQQHRLLLGAALLDLTPFARNAFIRQSQFQSRRDALKEGFQSLKSLGANVARPRFVVVHILAPHPPFVFGAEGQPIQPAMMFGYSDGSHYRAGGGSESSYREGYRGQAQWVDTQVIESLDSLLATAPVPPIIVIQGDHGSKLELDQESAVNTDVNECFSNLTAVLAPKNIQDEVQADITPVNLFRVILRGMFGENLADLKARCYYSKWSAPLEFEDITDRLEK